MRFLPEAPVRGSPFRMKSFEQNTIPKTNTNYIIQRISFEKEIPSQESRARNISQTSCPISAPTHHPWTSPRPNSRRHRKHPASHPPTFKIIISCAFFCWVLFVSYSFYFVILRASSYHLIRSRRDVHNFQNPAFLPEGISSALSEPT